MITLKRLNEVRQVASEERAAKLEKKGFTRIGGSAEAEGRPVTEADLEKLGDALLDRLKAESKGGTKKGGKAKPMAAPPLQSRWQRAQITRPPQTRPVPCR